MAARHIDAQVGYARYLQLLRRADHLIAISEATKRDAVERLGVAPEKITVTPLAIDDARYYRRSLTEVADAMTRYGLHAPYFLCVGSSDAHKNTDTLLRAFETYRRGDNTGHTLFGR